MRVLMTTDTVGGVWTFTSELATEFSKLGCDVALVSFGRRPSVEQNQRVQELSARFPGFRFAASDAPLEWMPQNGPAYTAGEALLLELCNSFRPDALLLSQFCYGALPVHLAKIVIAHSDVLSWAVGVGKAPLPNDEWLRTYRSLVQRGLDGADAVVAPTHAMLQAMGANFALPQEVHVIANGRTFAAADAPAQRKLQAVTAGRIWDDAKNIRLILECACPMPVLVAGESEGLECVNDSVKLIGRQTEAELLSLFRSSSIYICSSLYEPFGLAPLEAALCGCAVLANNIASLREVWGDSALYFSDASSLSDLLTFLRNSPSELCAAQARSQARACTYTSARMAKHYLEVIRSTRSKSQTSEAHAA